MGECFSKGFSAVGDGLALAGAACADLGALLGTDELQDAELTTVADAVLAELDDACVAAVAVLEAWCDVVEDVLDEFGGLSELAIAVALDLVAGGDVEVFACAVAEGVDGGFFVLSGGLGDVEPLEGRAVPAEFGDDLPSGVEGASLGFGYDFFDKGLDGLGAWDGGDDLAVLEEGCGEVAEGGLAVAAGAAEFVSCFAVAHG